MSQRVAIAADHGGFSLKEGIIRRLTSQGIDVLDFGAKKMESGDDYPDYVVPMARAVAAGEAERGIAICGSGVGACVAANKVAGVRAGLIHEVYSARQGVEDDNMNVICLGGRVLGEELAWDLLQAFLGAEFRAQERFVRRLAKVKALEAEYGHQS
jgi:ribose 5-phosphate isomerase B